ncbi:hypothetical protein Ddye_027827 [Dipteronia dyeriana]|uniref:Uncharacterized protein n=1 Tax=Dipteronia dyeriana TaxID=168575 RepID=A0AAD9TQA7_9ROSI|nr:hypothetical protein Ddye_027827 [Dipteronia dyeriana]
MVLFIFRGRKDGKKPGTETRISMRNSNYERSFHVGFSVPSSTTNLVWIELRLRSNATKSVSFWSLRVVVFSKQQLPFCRSCHAMPQPAIDARRAL